MKSIKQWWHERKIKRAEEVVNLIQSNRLGMTTNEMKEVLYDFFKHYNGSIPQVVVTQDGASSTEAIGTSPKKDERKEANPKDVLDELERVPNPIDLDPTSLAAKIELMERKINLGIDQRYTKEYMQGILDCLKNRKRYNEFKEFYERFQYTTQQKIENLLLKYKLCMKESTLFVPTFPDDATTAMEEYTAQTRKLTGKRPVFYVIAKEDDFKKKWEKHDPILLVQSPFGYFWQILGAWDEEMLLLEEL